MARRVSREERLFNPDGRKHYRRTYSVGEAKASFAILALLGVIAGWVVWRGQHPDPSLFAASIDQGDARVAVGVGDAGTTSDERGPLPAGLATDGFAEARVAHYDADNVYEKIDGREGYYKAFGFRGLYWVLLEARGDASTSVDVELYDLRKPENALGAFAGERDPDAEVDLGEEGLTQLHRNALKLTRGRYYIRAIGSDEGEQVRAQLEHLRARLQEALASQPLPWAYGLFVGKLGIDPGKVSYHEQNAFSLQFATQVYSAVLADDETEMFVRASTEAEAEAFAAKLLEGFESYGSLERDEAGAPWIKDRYLGGYATAQTNGPWVFGVRAAPSRQVAEQELARLSNAVAQLEARPTSRSEPSTEPTVVDAAEDAVVEH